MSSRSVNLKPEKTQLASLNNEALFIIPCVKELSPPLHCRKNLHRFPQLQHIERRQTACDMSWLRGRSAKGPQEQDAACTTSVAQRRFKDWTKSELSFCACNPKKIFWCNCNLVFFSRCASFQRFFHSQLIWEHKRPASTAGNKEEQFSLHKEQNKRGRNWYSVEHESAEALYRTILRRRNDKDKCCFPKSPCVWIRWKTLITSCAVKCRVLGQARNFVLISLSVRHQFTQQNYLLGHRECCLLRDGTDAMKAIWWDQGQKRGQHEGANVSDSVSAGAENEWRFGEWK